MSCTPTWVCPAPPPAYVLQPHSRMPCTPTRVCPAPPPGCVLHPQPCCWVGGGNPGLRFFAVLRSSRRPTATAVAVPKCRRGTRRGHQERPCSAFLPLTRLSTRTELKQAPTGSRALPRTAPSQATVPVRSPIWCHPRPPPRPVTASASAGARFYACSVRPNGFGRRTRCGSKQSKTVTKRAKNCVLALPAVRWRVGRNTSLAPPFHPLLVPQSSDGRVSAPAKGVTSAQK